MAEQLVNSMSDKFAPEKYSNEYRDNLMRIINDKLKGKKIEVPDVEEPEPTNVIDLMTRLQESLSQGGKSKKSAKRRSEQNEGKAKAESGESAAPKAESQPKAKKRRKTA